MRVTLWFLRGNGNNEFETVCLHTKYCFAARNEENTNKERGASPHIGNASLKVRKMFPGCVNSHLGDVSQPIKSPDLFFCDFRCIYTRWSRLDGYQIFVR